MHDLLLQISVLLQSEKVSGVAKQQWRRPEARNMRGYKMDFVRHHPTHLQGDLQERPGSATGRSAERAEDTALLSRPTLSFELTPAVESMESRPSAKDHVSLQNPHEKPDSVGNQGEEGIHCHLPCFCAHVPVCMPMDRPGPQLSHTRNVLSAAIPPPVPGHTSLRKRKGYNGSN